MPHPADQDPFTIMAAAAQHIADGVPEVEMEWWVDPTDTAEDGPPRRLTILMRSVDRWSSYANYGAAQAAAETPHLPDPVSWVPDTPEGLR